MKYLIHISGLLFIIFFLGCQNKDSQSPPLDSNPHPEKEELNGILKDYYQTMSDRDWEAYRDFFWEKATLTTTWQEASDSVEKVLVSTIDEFISKTPEGPDSQPIFEEKMIESNVDIQSDLASAWVKYEAKFGTQENLMEWQGLDLFSFMKHKGEWKIVSLVFSAE